jgi:hypothetical protein
LSHVIRIDGGRIRAHLDDVVHSTAEETLHAMLGGEANRPRRAMEQPASNIATSSFGDGPRSYTLNMADLPVRNRVSA